jgi:DNA-binding CsgD family transcriptional regulator
MTDRSAQNQRMAATDRRVIGRGEELATIEGLLAAREQLPCAVVLRGEAGIGKTTLWSAGTGAASDRGYRVLSSRPSQAETGFSFAGLADLLGTAAAEVLPELPPIQRRALEAALLLGESEVAADDRAVAAAFLGAVRLLAAEGPVCLAVDDVQWLDAASVAALRYALARLDAAPVAALLAVRGDLPDWLRRSALEDTLRTLDVGGLSLGATHELLRSRLGATFARPILIRLWETSQGNPFFALELAEALLQSGGTLSPGEGLPIPSDLDELLHARLDNIGPEAFEVACAVAALAEPTESVVEAAVGSRSEAGRAEALAARIVELDGERVRFTHPLLGSAVAARLTPTRRRTLHARLAEIAPTAEECARHLALASVEPSEEIAAILEHEAGRAQARGAPAAAAELAEHAVRLTPATNVDDARRRVLVAADMHYRAGDSERAALLLEQGRAAAAPGNARATVLVHLAGVQPDPRDAIALYREALRNVEGDDALEADIHLRLAGLMRFSEGVERGIDHSRLAVRAAAQVDDPALRCRALAAFGLMQFQAGRGIPGPEMEEALALERALPEWPLDNGPTFVRGHQLWWSADVDRARQLFEEVRAVATSGNDPVPLTSALWYLAFLEWRAGNWEAAERHAADSGELATQLGRLLPPMELPAAVIAAHRGRVDDARARANGAIDRAEAQEIRVAQSGHGWVLGFVELSLGDAAAALPFLTRAYELRNDFLLEPGTRLELGDLLETLVAVGELERADEVLATWQERAAALDRAWALAILARCRGLLLGARGDLEGALASFELALAEHARSTDPFHRARTLLALGRTQRRAKRRGDARTTLGEALAEFERLDAPLWAEQTRAELRRIGGRAPSSGELTEAERRIAALVAEGRTNKEVAAALFLAERTVASHLTRVYAKLGVRSRSELTLKLGRPDPTSGAVP